MILLGERDYYEFYAGWSGTLLLGLLAAIFLILRRTQTARIISLILFIIAGLVASGEYLEYRKAPELAHVISLAVFWLPPLLTGLVMLVLSSIIDRRNRNLIVCRKCGYDLRGQETCRCPECNTPIDEKQWRWLLARRDAELDIPRDEAEYK